MVLKNIFLSLAVGAATTAVAVTASADDTNGTTETTSTTTHHRHHTRGSATGSASGSAGASDTTDANADTSASGQTKGAVKKANAAADSAGDKANRAVVGSPQQNQNEANAQSPANGSPAEGRGAQQKTDETAKDVGRATTTAANVVATDVRDVTQATDHPGHFDPFAAELSPLGLFVGGRVSLNLEWVPVTHHAIVVAPHFVHTSADVATTGDTTTSQTFTGFGGELGYRYYTGHRGMNGVFVGPSLIAGAYNAGLPNGNQAFTDVGIAGDVGVQEIFFNHLVVGGGVGVEYLSVSHDFHDLPTGPSTIASSGVKPRLLLEAGYGF